MHNLALNKLNSEEEDMYIYIYIYFSRCVMEFKCGLYCMTGVLKGDTCMLAWHQKCLATSPTQAEARALLLASSVASMGQ